MTASRKPDATIASLSKAEHSNPPDEVIIEGIINALNSDTTNNLFQFLRQLSPPLSKEVIFYKSPFHNLMNLCTLIIFRFSDYNKGTEGTQELLRLIPKELLDQVFIEPIVLPEFKSIIDLTLLVIIFSDENISSTTKIYILNNVSDNVLNFNVKLILATILTPRQEDIIFIYLSRVDNNTLNQACISLFENENSYTILSRLVTYNLSARVIDLLMSKLTKDTINKLFSTFNNPVVSVFNQSLKAQKDANTTIMHIAKHVDREVLKEAAFRYHPFANSQPLINLSKHGPLMHKIGIMHTLPLGFTNDLTMMLLSKSQDTPMESIRYMASLNPRAEELTKEEKPTVEKPTGNRIINFFKHPFGEKKPIKAKKEEVNFKVQMANHLNRLELSQLLLLYNSLPETIKSHDGNCILTLLIISYMDTPTYFMPDMLLHEIHAPFTVPFLTTASLELHQYLNKAVDLHEMLEWIGIATELRTERETMLKEGSKTEQEESLALIKFYNDIYVNTCTKAINQNKTISPEKNLAIQTTLQYLTSNPYTLLAVNQQLTTLVKPESESKPEESHHVRLK